MNPRLLILLIILLVVAKQSFAVSFYDERPSIFSVRSQEHSSDTIDTWKEKSYGHFVLLAQLVTQFPDSHFYFLARDAEYLYDIGQLVFKNDPAMLKRLHVIPISTNLSFVNRTEAMVQFLEQEGVTAENLKGQSALFVDSCCEGTVPDAIISAMEAKKLNLKGFLIRNRKYPSSELAAHLGSGGDLIEILPHYTSPGEEYIWDKTQNRIRIKVKAVKSDFNPRALEVMEHLKFQFDRDDVRKAFNELRTLMQALHSQIVIDSPYQRASQDQLESAMGRLESEYNVPIQKLVEDLNSMQRQSYAAVHLDRIKNFKVWVAGNKQFQKLQCHAVAKPKSR